MSILSKNLYMFYTAEIGYWQGEGLTTDDGGQRMGDGGQRMEDGGRGTEDGGRRTND
jgi:hypothetical protein